MNRISSRINAAISTVKCPGCGKYVVATEPDETEPSTAERPLGKRWSFVWRPPSGVICPECSFPLERYARRAKWVRLFIGGIVLMTVSLLLVVLGMLSGFGPGLSVFVRLAVGAGLLALVVGLIGIIIGGRHGPT